jgi:hypothetical protein
MKLITELHEEIEYLTESRENGEKSHYIHGIFMQAETPNRNGRSYPLHILESAVNKYIESNIKENRGYGELGHPTGPQINLDRVSHMVTELKRNGNDFIGKAKLTKTPMGDIARGLLDSGAKLGVSSRGMGSLASKNGIMVVQPDFHLATAADIVADPSAPNAFVKGIMENVEWLYDPVEGTYHEQRLHDMKKSIKKMTMNEIEEKQFSIFENYVNSLSVKNKFI